MSGVIIAGDTSGSVTLQAPAEAGTTTLTLPATNGTVAIQVPSVNISTIANNTTFAINTPTKIADLGSLSDGTYGLVINFGVGYSGGTANTIYWGTVFSTVIGVVSANMYYNAAPNIENVIGNQTQHYRSVTSPTYTLKSDSSLGAYGRLSLYVSFPQSTTIDVWNIRVKNLGV